jgi:D-alanyl-D-alanine carboxypeptidase
MLGNMTSGLASFTFSPDFQTPLFANPARVWTPSELLAIAFAETKAGCPSTKGAGCSEPGKAFFYSNTNTVLLAVALENAGKRPYAELLKEHVLVPFDLRDTTVPTDTTLPIPFVRGMSTQGRERGEPAYEATDMSPTWAFAVGDVVSTPADLKKWARSLALGTWHPARAHPGLALHRGRRRTGRAHIAPFESTRGLSSGLVHPFVDAHSFATGVERQLDLLY